MPSPERLFARVKPRWSASYGVRVLVTTLASLMPGEQARFPQSHPYCHLGRARGMELA
jgi:hypothetical protein